MFSVILLFPACFKSITDPVLAEYVLYVQVQPYFTETTERHKLCIALSQQRAY